MSDTKMRPIQETIPLDQALALVAESAVPVTRTEPLSLAEADGRVLAADIVAGADVPPFDRAAMDGFAVSAEDTFGASRQSPRTLRQIETVHTGEVPAKRLGPGQCTEIATGAPMPQGADAVVMVEETDRGSGTEIHVFTPVYPKQHVGRRGADIASGEVLLKGGDVLTPSRLGSIAALGMAEIEVFDRPRIAILSTGNEIIEPGEPLGPGQIYDINRFTLGAVIGEHGGVALRYPTAADTLDALEGSRRHLSEQRCVGLLGRQLGWGTRPDAGRADAQGEGAVSWNCRQARKADGVRNDWPHPGVRDARVSHLVSLERIPAADSVAPANRAPTTVPDANGLGTSSPALCLDHRTTSVLHGTGRRRDGRACIQGVGRHHQHVPGRWLH